MSTSEALNNGARNFHSSSLRLGEHVLSSGVSIAFVFPPMSDVVRNVNGVIPRNSGTFISDNEIYAAEEHLANDVSINVYFHVTEIFRCLDAIYCARCSELSRFRARQR